MPSEEVENQCFSLRYGRVRGRNEHRTSAEESRQGRGTGSAQAHSRKESEEFLGMQPGALMCPRARMLLVGTDHSAASGVPMSARSTLTDVHTHASENPAEGPAPARSLLLMHASLPAWRLSVARRPLLSRSPLAARIVHCTGWHARMEISRQLREKKTDMEMSMKQPHSDAYR